MSGEKKLSVRTFRKMKKNGEKIVMLTAYDAPTARFASECGIEIVLVGDSLGMAVLGYQNTIPVTMEESLHHCKAVRRGAEKLFVVGDMPFMSYHLSEAQALSNAARFLQEAFCDAVKLECDSTTVPTVDRLVAAGIPVMAHIGLLPQSIKTSGGYRVAGREKEEAEALLATAKALESAGAFAIVLECVPAELSKRISESLEIPTIGIGAGVYCDGQVQVVSDILGMFTEFRPKHSKCYADLGSAIRNAFRDYAADVKSQKFPGPENSF